MRFFLRSKQFKKGLATVAIILALSITAWLIGGFMSPQAGIFGAIAAPFQKLGSWISDGFSDMSEGFESATKLTAEKKALEEELAALREQLVDYEEAINENKFYEDYLDIKQENEDFKFCSAMVTATDPDDEFGGFTVDAGSLSGVSLYDPVITHEGLVGYVTEVGATTSKVTTILSPSLTCGAYDSRTSDSGAVSGDYELAVKGQTRFYNLPRTCSVAIGDLIVTSGSGLFPDKIIIGSVSNISSDPLSSSLYATITPTVDFSSLRRVMIVTDFLGQGNELTGE